MDPNTVDPQQPVDAKPGEAGSTPRRKRIGSFIAIALIVLFLIFEVSARLWLAYGKHIPMGRPDSIELAYYPELRDAKATRINSKDRHFDVLILGGSAYFDYYGGPALHLQRALEAAGYPRVRIWNMAKPAHTSRDSLIKYRWLAGKHFDWVIVYDGINDLRANNVEGKNFRKDYSHMRWYSEVNALAGEPARGLRAALAAPLLWDYLRLKLHARRHNDQMIEYNETPNDKSMAYGSEIRSAKPFGNNISEMVQLAKERHDYMTLVTYGSYLDPKYTLERMKHDQEFKVKHTSGTLELSYATETYSDQADPCEIWGKPANLVKGIQAQNAQIRQVAHREHVGMVDFAKKIPQDGKYFIDICHLSTAGVDLLTRTVLGNVPSIKGRPIKHGAKGKAAVAAGAKATSATAEIKPAAAGTQATSTTEAVKPAATAIQATSVTAEAKPAPAASEAAKPATRTVAATSKAAKSENTSKSAKSTKTKSKKSRKSKKAEE